MFGSWKKEQKMIIINAYEINRRTSKKNEFGKRNVNKIIELIQSLKW